MLKLFYILILVVAITCGCNYYSNRDRDTFPILEKKENPNMKISYREFNGKFKIGDCFKFTAQKDYYILYVEYISNSGVNTFTPLDLGGNDSSAIHERLLHSNITYYTRQKNTDTEKMIEFLGGEMPIGYFGFTVTDPDILHIRDSLRYICTFDLDLDLITTYGGIYYLTSHKLRSIIEHCQNPFEVERKDGLLGKEISYKIPLNRICY